MTARFVVCLVLCVAASVTAQEPPAVGASFQVVSEPPGATVEVSPPGDPRFYAKGVAPCQVTVQRALPGEWAVRLTLPDHIPAVRSGSLPSGELRVELWETAFDDAHAYPIALESADETPAIVIAPSTGGDPIARIDDARWPAWSPTDGRLAFRRGQEVILWSPAGERSLGAMPGDRLTFTPDGEFVTVMDARATGELALICRPVSGGEDRVFLLGAAPQPGASVRDFDLGPTGETVAVAWAWEAEEQQGATVTLYRLAGDREPVELPLPADLPAPSAVAFDPVLPALWMLIPRDASTDRPSRAVHYLMPEGLIAIQTPPPGADDFETVERLAFSAAGRWLAVSGGTAVGAHVTILPWRVVGQAAVTHVGRVADWRATE
ncbi:MAG: hypothetical protein KBA64_09135 [Armatimonadetes bacterium]|jgi:hypothetical protein|nr:hypothetical protein [Armatimonadota bacterium]